MALRFDEIHEFFDNSVDTYPRSSARMERFGCPFKRYDQSISYATMYCLDSAARVMFSAMTSWGMRT